MYNKKHIAALTSIIMAAALLTGCQENTAPLTNSAVTNENLAPASAAESDYNAVDLANSAVTAIADENAPLSAVVPDPSKIILNCTLPDDVPAQVPLLKTGLHKFTTGVPEKLFLDDAGLVLGEDYTKYDHPDEEHYVYSDAASNLLLMGYCDGDVSKYDRDGDYCYTTIRSLFDCYKMSEYFTEKELAGFTAEDAVNRGNALLEQLGITNAGTPEVYAITAEKANAYIASETWENKDGTPAEVDMWTTDDEVYFLTYPIVLNGIPVTTHCVNRGWINKTDGFEGINGGYIEMTVRKDRIAEIHGFRIFENDAEVIGTANIAVTPQQALDKLVEHYNGITEELFLDDMPVTVNSCNLVYVEDRNMETDEYTFKPVWQFELQWEKGSMWNLKDDDVERYGVEYDIVDAVTGDAHFDAF